MVKNNEFEILKKIAQDFYSCGGNMYYVGGFVRDKMLGIDNKDIDIEIHDIDYNSSIEILKKYGVVDLVGASFGVIKVHGLDIDFAFPRTENSVGAGHKDFEVYINPNLSPKESSKRRDFTVNSVMQNVFTEEIIDNYNGLEDLNKKLIKHVDSDTFVEDPLRALRACGFASRFEFNIDESTKELCKTMDITTLSKERIYEEIKKALLKASKPSLFIKYLIDIEKFDDIFCVNKNNILNLEKLDELYKILDSGANIKNKSQNAELFMFSCLVYGLFLCISEFNEYEFLKKISYKKELNESILNLLKNNAILSDLENLDNYYLRKLAVSSKNKSFNIDDVILFNKISNSNFINEIWSKIEEVGLNEERTIFPLIIGKHLAKFEIEPSIEYKDILNKCFELQLKADYQELFKYLLEEVLLNSKKTSKFFNILKENNKLEQVIPELIKLDKTMQNPLYHPEGSVYNHTMNVIDVAAQNREFAEYKYEFMFAALCHDFGKISTTFTKEDGKIVSYGHENQLEESKEFLQRLNIVLESKEIILKLQKNHMRPFMLYKQNSTNAAVRRLKRDVGKYYKDLLLLSYCDKSGCGVKTEERFEELNRYKMWFQDKELLC